MPFWIMWKMFTGQLSMICLFVFDHPRLFYRWLIHYFVKYGLSARANSGKAYGRKFESHQVCRFFYRLLPTPLVSELYISLFIYCFALFLQVVEKTCRCGRKHKKIPCSQQMTCETKCPRIRSCGRHPCKKKVLIKW